MELDKKYCETNFQHSESVDVGAAAGDYDKKSVSYNSQGFGFIRWLTIVK